MSNAFSDKLPIEKPQDCMSRVISGTTSSFVAGGIIGALTANWGDIPQVLQDKPLPALKRTGKSYFADISSHLPLSISAAYIKKEADVVTADAQVPLWDHMV